MSSKKDRLNEELTQEVKKPIKKKRLNPDEIKKLAEQEHNLVDEIEEEKSIPGKPSKKVHRTTIDFPRMLWTDVKKAAADEYMSIKDYLLMLIKKDLRERKGK